MLTVMLASLLLYLGVFAFYHAGKNRTGWPKVKASPLLQKLTRLLGWGLVSLSLVFFSSINGAERGVAYWLAMFVATGLLSLMLAAWRPELHRRTGLPVAAFASLILTVSFMEGL